MNGIFIVAIIACLIFCVGIGFGVLTVHNEVLRYSAQMKRQMDALEKWQKQVEAWIGECQGTETELAKMVVQSDGNARSASVTAEKIRAEISAINLKTLGTADPNEFKRLQTQVLITLPKRIERLDAIVTGKPYAARIEKRDGLIAMRYVPDDEIREKFEEKEAPDAQS